MWASKDREGSNLIPRLEMTEDRLMTWSLIVGQMFPALVTCFGVSMSIAPVLLLFNWKKFSIIHALICSRQLMISPRAEMVSGFVLIYTAWPNICGHLLVEHLIPK
jgi:hypothetical protein